VTDYHINIFYSEEDGGYIADIPDLDSCSAFGRTAEEALAEVERALRLRLRSRSGQAPAAWLEAARAAGRPIPRPRYRPAIYQTRG
jgi:predicted RNase H-like HicB family nuclease